MAHDAQEDVSLQKDPGLPPEKVTKIEDTVDFLRQRDEDRRLSGAATQLAEGVFQKVWNNEDDADYDRI